MTDVEEETGEGELKVLVEERIVLDGDELDKESDVVVCGTEVVETEVGLVPSDVDELETSCAWT